MLEIPFKPFQHVSYSLVPSTAMFSMEIQLANAFNLYE